MNIMFKDLTVQAIYQSYEDAHNEAERPYLGGSVIGDACARKLFYGYRWACEPEKFEGRMLRLFQTGHLEEPRLIEDLRRSGVTVFDVDPETGRQFAVSAIGGHFRGHLDGRAMGIKEAPKTEHVLEFKTHNAKSFAKLLKGGVATAKPLHFAQMQVYMQLSGLTRALYLAKNKDDDALYSERVELDPVHAGKLLGKAEAIITAHTPPSKLHEDPDSKLSFDCNYCPAANLCHRGAWARRNCRTCISATPELDGDGRWTCDFHKRDLTVDDQRAGCAAHRYIPDLVPGYQIDADPEARTITYAMADGSEWVDGGE